MTTPACIPVGAEKSKATDAFAHVTTPARISVGAAGECTTRRSRQEPRMGGTRCARAHCPSRRVAGEPMPAGGHMQVAERIRTAGKHRWTTGDRMQVTEPRRMAGGRMGGGARAGRCAMTFIEVLIAVALSALIIIAASMLTFTLTNTWGNLQTRPQFEQHVQGVTATIETLFERTETLSGDAVRPWGWTAPPEGNVRTFAFRLRDPLPLFVLPYGPQGIVEAWLEFDPERKRLWLTWYTEARLTQNRRQLQHTLLSDQIEDIELGYLDSSTNIWEFESMSQTGRTHADRSPSRLRITFAPGGDSGSPIYRTINPERPLRRILLF